MSDVMDPRLKPLALGYGQGLSEFMMAIHRVSFQKKDVDWIALKPAEYDATMSKELGVTVATYKKKLRLAGRLINKEFSVYIGGSIIHPEFRVGDEVNYGFPRDKAGRPTLKGVKVTEITYYAGLGGFRYWIEGLGHDVDEDELIWWTPMSQRGETTIQMSDLVNSVQLIGILGDNPEMRQLEDGQKEARFAIGTKEIDQEAEDTLWHVVVCRSPMAELVEKYLKRGTKIKMTGRLVHRHYEDAGGRTVYLTEIELQHFTAI